MRLVKRGLFKKLFFKSTILVFGPIAIANPVLSNPVEFNCIVTGSYGVNNRIDVNPKRRKDYPTKLSKNVSEKFEKFKVIFDTNKGMGTINGSEAKIISSKIDVSKDRGPIMSPLVLYSSAANYQRDKSQEGNADSGFTVFLKKQQDIEKRYLILDKGYSRVSKFTLLDIFENTVTDIVTAPNKKNFDAKRNILHETYYGGCKHPKN